MDDTEPRQRLWQQLKQPALYPHLLWRGTVWLVVIAEVRLVAHLLNPSGGDTYTAFMVAIGSGVAGAVVATIRAPSPDAPDDPDELGEFEVDAPARPVRVVAPVAVSEVLLVAVGSRRADVVRELTVACGLTDRAARRLCDAVPATAWRGADPEQAQVIAGRLQRAGAVVELPPPRLDPDRAPRSEPA